jgi:putative ABC transport system permease protein
MREFLLRLKALLRRRRFEQDLQDEVAFHLAMREESRQSASEPAGAARKEFGNTALIREQCRELRSFVLLEALWQDIRYGVRLLRHSPVFTAVAVLTLALGIGANTAVFSLTYQVLLQLLPVSHPEELVVLRSPGPRQGHTDSDGDGAASFSYPLYKDIRERSSHVFSGLLARNSVSLSVSGLGNTERASGELVSGNYFEVLRVNPALGRVFNPQDETAAGANAVAVLSYGYWTRHFGGDPSVLNKQVNVNGTLLTIVGVSREGFTGVEVGQLPDVFIPITMKQQIEPNSDLLTDRKYHWTNVIGRLRPGLNAAGSEKALEGVFRPLLEAEAPLEQITPAQMPQFLIRKLLLEDGSRGRLIVQRDTREPLIILTAMVGVVLVIACTNLAGLLVARGEARQREIAVRLSLGAGRARLLRQLLTEGLLLGVTGGAVGAVIAPWLLRTILTAIPQGVGLNGLHAELDARTLAFTLVLALVTTVLFALAPAQRLLRTDTQTALRAQNTSASASAASTRLRKGLIICQVIFTTILLAAAGLFTRSLLNIKSVRLGFDPDHVIEFSVAPEFNRYTPVQTLQVFERLRESIATLPGVRSVSAAQVPVLTGDSNSGSLTVEGYAPSENESMRANRNWVSPNYFATLSVPLLAGREFLRTDAADAPKVAIINEALAQKYFAGRNPIGMHIALRNTTARPEIEVVGVVQNSKHAHPRDEVFPFAYLPYAQNPKLGQATFYVRGTQDPLLLGNALRAVVASVDHDLPVYHLMTLTSQRDESVFADRLVAVLCLVMGLLAALLAALGLYGVMAFIVARRTREIGIRMALGASRGNVAWLVLREVARITSIGLLIGLCAAVVTSHFIQSQLFGVSGYSPAVLGMTVGLLLAVALLAGGLPARRAASVEPTVALRYE